MSTDSALEKALALANLGFHVFPVVGKRPAKYGGAGLKEASNDPDMIRALWADAPGDRVGYWTGPSGVVVLDIDVKPGDNGFDTLTRLEAGEEAVYWEGPTYYPTPSGGQHTVFQAPEFPPGPAAPVRGYPGIDRRSGDSYAIWYGDVPVVTGDVETWRKSYLPPAPEWLLGKGGKARATSTRTGPAPVYEGTVQGFIDGLSAGEPNDHLLADSDRYGYLKDALGKLVTSALAFPTMPGHRETLDALVDAYLNSSHASTPVEERPKKVVDLLTWWLGVLTPETEDMTAGYEWAVKAQALAEERQVVEAAQIIAADAESYGWEPEDFEDVLDGTFTVVEPTVLRREDGVSLFYPGKVNTVFGAPESAKSWVCQFAAVQEVNAGRHVRYLDYESDRGTVIGRMLMLGAKPEKLREFMHYYRPEAVPTFSTSSREWYEMLLNQPASLVVLDGTTEALAQSGTATKDNDEVTVYMRAIPKKLAERTGAAVVLVDHITKATGDDQRYALGAQAKLAAIDGAAYLVDVDSQPAPGRVGLLLLKITKDRNGYVRARSDLSGGGRMALTAEFEMDSTNAGKVIARLKAFDQSRVLGKAAKLHSEALDNLKRLYSEAGAAGFASNAKVLKAWQDAGLGSAMSNKELVPLLEHLENDQWIEFDRTGKPQAGYPSRMTQALTTPPVI